MIASKMHMMPHTVRLQELQSDLFMEVMDIALNRKEQKNCRSKVTGDVEARMCAIACSTPTQGASRWTMQAIADELIRLEVVDYITDTTVCEVMKKTKLNRGL